MNNLLGKGLLVLGSRAGWLMAAVGGLSLAFHKQVGIGNMEVQPFGQDLKMELVGSHRLAISIHLPSISHVSMPDISRYGNIVRLDPPGWSPRILNKSDSRIQSGFWDHFHQQKLDRLRLDLLGVALNFLMCLQGMQT